MAKREEIEGQLSELTQAELAEFILIGASLLRRTTAAGGDAQPFFFIKVGGELLAYFNGPAAEIMQESVTKLMHKHGGQQVEITK